MPRPMNPSTAPHKLLLWDIDGTLVHTGKAGEFAMGTALKRRFGMDGSIEQVDFRGRTDKYICLLLLEKHGIEPTEENLHDFMEGYLEALHEELPLRNGIVFPGVLDLLDRCHARADITNALLTGNLERGARLKLEHYQVWHYFEFGAYADDSHDRNQLGPVALRRAAETAGLRVTPDNVWIIGDTPHDIACARVIGARVIAVATGGHTPAELAAHSPDALFPDFSHPDAVMAIIDG